MSSFEDKSKTTITTSSVGTGARLSVKLSVAPKSASPAQVQRYVVSKHELGVGYNAPESIRSLIPSKVPDYLDDGEGYVERIMRALYYFKQTALVGPSGAGKIHAVYMIAQMSGLPLWEVNCGLQTSATELFGRFVGPQKESWTEGTIVSWYRQGGILYLDEANLMTQDVAAKLNPILDAQGQVVIPERDNEVVPRNPFAYAVVSMDSYSSDLPSNKSLDAVFRRRMGVWIDFDYLSVGSKISPNEVKMVSERAKVPTGVAEKVVRVGAEMRKRYKSGDLPYGPSVDDLTNWATFIADGLDPNAAADETLVSLTSGDPEIQAVVRRIVTLVFGPGDGKPVEKTEHP